MFLFIILAFFIELFIIPINGRPINIPIGNNTVIVNGFKETKQFLISLHESDPNLHNYNWETFRCGIATAFLGACLLSATFYGIATCIKEGFKISEKGRKYDVSIIGFILGATGVCDVIHASKTPFLFDETGYLGLDDKKVYHAILCIFGGTFLGFLYALLITIFKKRCIEKLKTKAMWTIFWGPSYGQLIGTIMYNSGSNIKGFQMDRALIAVFGCLICSVIGCTILHAIRKKLDDKFDDEKIHETWLGGSMMMASLFYMLYDNGLFD